MGNGNSDILKRMVLERICRRLGCSVKQTSNYVITASRLSWICLSRAEMDLKEAEFVVKSNDLFPSDFDKVKEKDGKDGQR